MHSHDNKLSQFARNDLILGTRWKPTLWNIFAFKIQKETGEREETHHETRKGHRWGDRVIFQQLDKARNIKEPSRRKIPALNCTRFE